MAAVNAVGRAAGLEPLEQPADARAGDLYERHARRVFAYCLSRLGRREDAEDAVQTTFLHAVNGLRRGVAPSHELAWLLGIARNVCLTRLESAGRRGRLELVCDPVDLERNEAPRGRRDELIGLEVALARLPEQQRRAVLLRDWRGLSYEEVAAQLGVTLANAETLIFRGRRTLADLLREEPAATRRRLASLGNAGSLLTWAKTAFTGAAAASKLAAAVAVVAIAGGGIAASSAAPEPDAPAARPNLAPAGASVPAPPPRSAPSDTVSQGGTAPTAAPARPRPSAPAPTPAPRERGGAPEGAGDTVSQGAKEPAATADGSAGPAQGDAPPRPAVTVTSVVEDAGDTASQAVSALAPVAAPVQDAVESVPVPNVLDAPAKVVETVAAAAPPAPPETPLLP